jgi:hypothetical protein
MSTPPRTDVHATPIGTQTERVLHDFVRNAVMSLSEALTGSAPTFEDDIRFERGADGHFRERKKRIWTLCPTLSDEWLRSLPDYERCTECLKSGAIIGPHLDRLVGTSTTASRLEARNILMSLIYAMLDEEGCLTFSCEKFQSKWQELADFFGADRIAYKTVAPLPHLIAPAFPLRLNDELVLDRLSVDEVTRCHQVGVIRPTSLRFRLIYAEIAVGLRRTKFLPKLLRQGDEPGESPDAGDEGSFGRRPLFRDDLTIDDVLSALRLFKRTHIRAAGLAKWTDSPWLAGGIEYRVLGQWPYGGNFELTEGDVPHFLELWHLLEEGAARFSFSIHRFNLAFDRGLLADRIVDLVVAAEALFLGDLDEGYRGELRFRLALRAAKFIAHASYSEQEVFRVMRRAYDARSATVHGGSPKDTRLPDNQSADLPTFIDAIEDLVRLGLRKALSMEARWKQDGSKMEARWKQDTPTRVLGRPRIFKGHPPVSLWIRASATSRKGHACGVRLSGWSGPQRGRQWTRSVHRHHWSTKRRIFILGQAYSRSFEPFSALDEIDNDGLPFGEVREPRSFESGDMDEDVLATVEGNEAVASLGIEPLHCAGLLDGYARR